MNLCYLAKFGKNKFNLWHMLLGAIAGGAHTAALAASRCDRLLAALLPSPKTLGALRDCPVADANARGFNILRS